MTHLHIFREKPVEEVDVCGPEMHQVLELLNGRGLHSQEPEACGLSVLGGSAGG